MARETLDEVHKDIWRCRKCAGILNEDQILPRSGFPPEGKYRAVVVGAEPGQRAMDVGRPTPEEYKRLFAPGAGNTNKARLIFEHLQAVGAGWNEFFYTNSVKCPAQSGSQSKRCWTNCEDYLKRQVEAIWPKTVVVMGKGADNLGLQKAARGESYRAEVFGFPALVMTHPQGATREYLERIAGQIKASVASSPSPSPSAGRGGRRKG